MKYCTNCGTPLEDDALFCQQCGHAVTDAPQANAAFGGVPAPAAAPAQQESALKLAAKILMIISCVTTGLYLIPLAWTIPMTVSYWNKVRDHRPVSTGFKVCTLIFVNTIAGILMLCDDTPN